MRYDLENKIALVTGGSRGLGAAISLALANSGAKVAVNYFSREQEAEKLKASIIESKGVAEIFQVDVTNESEVEKLCEEITEQFGLIEILVVNATLIQIHKSIEELVWQDMLDHLHFFVKSPLLLMQQVLGVMKEKKYGRIIQIGSEVFERGIPGF